MIAQIAKFTTLIGATLLATACVQHIRNSGTADLAARADASDLRLASYNVHYIILSKATGAWSVADWDRRKGPMDLAFKAIDADVIGFQEMESFQRGGGDKNLTLEWLLAQNPEYSAGAVGPYAKFPSTQPILFRTDAFDLLDQGWFFFSDTPDVIYSRTFNGSFPAFASWVKLRNDQGQEFRVLNVHFEFKSSSNRLQSAQLVAERVAPWIAANETVFLIGDINARAGAEPIEVLEGAGFDFLPIAGSTYHLNYGLNLFGAIDHIAVAGNAKAQGAPVVLREKFDGEWPSDHYPVIADITLD